MEKNKKPLIIEMLVDEMDETGVDFISFVENPAIEVDFMYFNEKKKNFRFKETSEEKRLVTGPAMIPNEKIIRFDKNEEPFFVFFSHETIRLCNELFFKQSKQNTSNIDHTTGIEGVTVIESWIIEDPKNDKALALGFEGLPKGTWMITYKVYNEEVWNMVKNGEVLGFSVEGMFGQKLEEFKAEEGIEITDEEFLAEIEVLVNSDKSGDEIYDEIKKTLEKSRTK